MNKIKHFFLKYLLSSIAVIFLFLIINTALIIILSKVMLYETSDMIAPVSEIMNEFTIDSKGHVYVTKDAQALLTSQASWAMILDNNGDVIWENNLPANFSRSYTISEVAQFSRWYLHDYPVVVQTLDSSLLVVGYPASRMSKLYYIVDYDIVSLAKRCSILIGMANIIIIIALFYWNMRRLQNEILPIMIGIETISHGKPVDLPETGDLAQVYTKLNKAGQYISQKELARTEWINGISHDIRTPLSLILGYASELESDSSLPEDVRDQAKIICNQGQTLRSLVSDLNLSSKLEYSMQPLTYESLSPSELIRQVISTFLNNGLDEKYDFTLDISDEATSTVLNGDPFLLKRMLTNLIQNSISHNPDGCHITVSLSSLSGHCKLVIQDDGVGISNAQREQFNTGEFLLHPYKIMEESPHGFGLRLVYQIIQAHKGNISFEANQPSGLKVTLIL